MASAFLIDDSDGGWPEKIFLLVSKQLSTDWKDLGRVIGIPEWELRAIQVDYRDEGTKEMAFQLLLKWKEKMGRSGTLNALVNHLRNIDRNDIADVLNSYTIDETYRNVKLPTVQPKEERREETYFSKNKAVSTLRLHFEKATLSEAPIPKKYVPELQLHLDGKPTVKEKKENVKVPPLTGTWGYYNGLTTDDLRISLENRRENGYRPTVLTGYNNNGFERYVVLWKKDGSAEWNAMYGLSKNEYIRAVADFKSKDYFPVRVSGYFVNDTTKFSVIFVKKPGSVVETKVDMSADTFNKMLNDFHNTSYMIVDYNAYSSDGTDLYAAIWEKRTTLYGLQYYNNYELSALQTECDKKLSDGFKINTVCGYNMGGTDYFAALLEKGKVARGQGSNWGLSVAEYKQKLDNIIVQNFTLTYVHVFASGSSIKFNIVWDK